MTADLPPMRDRGYRGSMLAIATTLVRSWELVVAGPAVAVVAAAIVIFALPRKYTVTTSFIPQSLSQSDISSLAGGLSAQLGLGNLNPSSAFGSPDFYRKLLGIETILGEITDSTYVGAPGSRFTGSLGDYWKIKGATPALRRDRLVRRLAEAMTVNVDPRIQLVEVRATTTSPFVSQAIVKKALDVVSRFNLERRQSQSAQEAQFIGNRLEEARRGLHDAEDSVARFVERNRDFRNAPYLTVQYDGLEREVALRQSVYSALSQRYEQSRIDEVRDTPVLTVVQQPDLPVRPDSRHLALKLLLALAGGTVVSVLLALWRAYLSTGGMSDTEEDLAAFELALGNLREELGRPLRRLAGRVRASGARSGQ